MKKTVAITVFALLFHPGLIIPAQATTLTSVSQQHIVPLPKISSSSVLVVDLGSQHILYQEQAHRTMPIASLTKLMTALVVLDAKQSLNEIISVDIHQTKELKGVYSRVRVGSQISRIDMLHMALMSSENRAAASLAHHYPGGYARFIQAMNAKARALGMSHTHYVEPTGLSEYNVSSASDLIKLLKATEKYPLLSRLSTTAEANMTFAHPRYSLPFRNTNRLVRRADWDILLTKTGFTNKAGRCLTMRTMLGDRQIAIVLLDAYGKYTTFADANRLRQWLEAKQALKIIASDA